MPGEGMTDSKKVVAATMTLADWMLGHHRELPTEVRDAIGVVTAALLEGLVDDLPESDAKTFAEAEVVEVRRLLQHAR